MFIHSQESVADSCVPPLLLVVAALSLLEI